MRRPRPSGIEMNPAPAWTTITRLLCAPTPLVVALIAICIMSAPVSALQSIPGLSQDEQPVESDAATTDPSVPDAFASPAATMQTFITAMAEYDIDTAVRCLDLTGIIEEKHDDLANKLYRIINRIEFVNFDGPYMRTGRSENIGDASKWVWFPKPMISGQMPFIMNPQTRVQQLAPEARIVLARDTEDGYWRFNQATVEGIDDFWDRVSGLSPVLGISGETEKRSIAERMQMMFPRQWNEKKVLGVKYWQWACLFAAILIGIILDFLTRMMLRAISIRIIRRKGGEASNETLRRTVRPFGLTVAGLIWLWAVTELDLPNEALKVLVPAIKLFAMLASVWSAYRVTDLLGEVALSKAERTSTRFDDLLIPLIRKAVKVFITAFGLIYIAGALNVPIAPLLTGLGIGGAGFAFAAKDTLEHFFGSVTVIADRPFEVGDWVVIGDVEGTVESLGFRSTRVRTFYNSLITVPNGNLVRAVVDNYGRRKYRRWSTHLNITYDTHPDLIDAFCEGIRELIRFHPYTRKDYYHVWLHKFGAHSLDILLYVFFECPDWNTELRERHRLATDIIRLADRLGVEFAFPTQTLHLRKDDPDAAHEPGELPDGDTDRRSKAIGKRAVRAIVQHADYREEIPGPHVIETNADFEEAIEDPDTQIESKGGGDA